MSRIQWEKSTSCYERFLALDFLPPGATVVYNSTNNMALQSNRPPLFNRSGFHFECVSQDVIVVGDEKSSDYLLAGALTAFRSQTFFTLVVEANRNRGIVMRQPMIKPDETPEKSVILRGNDWRKLLIQYAELAACEMGVPEMDTRKNFTGYCSWYYYYADVTEADFLENIDALKKFTKGVYVPQVVQIDDGYQAFQGDWLDQDASWPTPLAEIARRITDAGMTAGIWLMPMLASTASRTFREHPEWFVRGCDGKPMLFAGWSPAPDNLWGCLDATQEAVRKHLRDVMRSFWEMGFHYFKMDGLGFGLPEGVFSAPDATPVSAFRLALKTIREAVPEAILLGCCPPFMPCLGYVDLCRVSNDTSRYWDEYGCAAPDVPRNSSGYPGMPGIRNALHGTESNWWMADRWFRADPDVIMARADNAFYTVGEARISGAAAILTGVALTSDHLGRITPDRLRILECAAKYRLRDALPAKWLPDHWPTAFTGKVDGKNGALFINDSTETMIFSLADYGVSADAVEVLAGAEIKEGAVTVPSHDAALVIG